MLLVQCERGRSGIDLWSAHLDRLNALSVRPDPFSTADYLRAYVDHSEYFPNGMDVRLFIIQDGRDVVGVVPMRAVVDSFVSGLGASRLEFLVTHDNEQPHVVCAAGDEDRVAEAFVNHVLQRESPWSLVEFKGQPEHSALRRVAHARASKRLWVRDIPISPYSEVTLGSGDLAGYYASLSKRMRSNISRQTRRLFSAGAVEFLLAEGAQACTALFDAYLELENASWKFATPAAAQRHPQRVAFLRAVAAGHAGSEPSLVAICLDGQMVAGLLCASHGQGSWALEMAYDETHADLGPGQLLLLLATALALERRHHFFNFLQSYGYYKQRWGADSVEVVNVQLIRRPGLHHLKGVVGDWNRRRRPYDIDAPKLANDQRHARPASLAHPSRAQATQLLNDALCHGGPGVRRYAGAAASAHLPFATR